MWKTDSKIIKNNPEKIIICFLFPGSTLSKSRFKLIFLSFIINTNKSTMDTTNIGDVI